MRRGTSWSYGATGTFDVRGTDMAATKSKSKLTRTSQALRGVAHVSFVTPEMDLTVRFYSGILGFPLVAARRKGPLRWYFFRVSDSFVLTFHEIPNPVQREPGLDLKDGSCAEIDHLAFDVEDEAALDQLRERLRSFDCEVSATTDFGMFSSMYFCDPHGLMLEASYWHGDSLENKDSEWFVDPDPVPALRELVDNGDLSWVPRTSFDVSAVFRQVLFCQET
jgi:catechol 2,3-dioxygenase-like lactoylglutathione lyase family enzyme